MQLPVAQKEVFSVVAYDKRDLVNITEDILCENSVIFIHPLWMR